MTGLWVALGAAAGAPVRYLVDRAVQRRHHTGFPLGIFLVNVVGSLVLGAVVGAALPPTWVALVGTGFCGALTTYSTFGHDTVVLLEERELVVAALYAVGSTAVGVGAAAFGLWVGGALV